MLSQSEVCRLKRWAGQRDGHMRQRRGSGQHTTDPPHPPWCHQRSRGHWAGAWIRVGRHPLSTHSILVCSRPQQDQEKVSHTESWQWDSTTRQSFVVIDLWGFVLMVSWGFIMTVGWVLSWWWAEVLSWQWDGFCHDSGMGFVTKDWALPWWGQ